MQVASRSGQRASVNADGFLGVPAQIADATRYLSHRIASRLAALRNQQIGKRCLVSLYKLRQAVESIGTAICREFRPLRKGCIGGFQCG